MEDPRIAIELVYDYCMTEVHTNKYLLPDELLVPSTEETPSI